MVFKSFKYNYLNFCKIVSENKKEIFKGYALSYDEKKSKSDLIYPFFRCFNVSVVKMKNNRYLYAVRTVVITPKSDTSYEKELRPGNDESCGIDVGKNFFWNRWSSAGDDKILFFTGDSDGMNLKITKVKKELVTGFLYSVFLGDGYRISFDNRLTSYIDKDNNEMIILYDTKLSFIYKIEIEKPDVIYIERYRTECKHVRPGDRNLQPLKLKPSDDLDLYLNWYTQYGIQINSCIDLGEYFIPYKENIILGEGSSVCKGPYGCGVTKSFLKDNYGIMPGFSFGTPHIPINHQGNSVLGVGHVKIHSDEDKYPYLEDSAIQIFRKNLQLDMKEKFGQKYIRHFGTGENCDGYIYMLYFYIIYDMEKNSQAFSTKMAEAFQEYYKVPLLERGKLRSPHVELSEWKMKISNAYLPLDFRSRKKLDPDDDFYQFSLVFPMGLARKDDETIMVTCGVGDFYSVALEFNLQDVIDSCTHDATDLNMVDYRYYLIQQTNHGVVVGDRIEKSEMVDVYVKKYLKYKSKYLMLKNNR